MVHHSSSSRQVCSPAVPRADSSSSHHTLPPRTLTSLVLEPVVRLGLHLSATPARMSTDSTEQLVVQRYCSGAVACNTQAARGGRVTWRWRCSTRALRCCPGCGTRSSRTARPCCCRRPSPTTQAPMVQCPLQRLVLLVTPADFSQQGAIGTGTHSTVLCMRSIACDACACRSKWSALSLSWDT